jgi:hypothetical protein
MSTSSSIHGDIPTSSVHGDSGSSEDGTVTPRKLPKQRGKPMLYYILASCAGWWPSLYPKLDILGIQGDQSVMMGCVVAEWHFVSLSDADASVDHQFFHAAAQHVKANVQGYIAYNIMRRIPVIPEIVADISIEGLLEISHGMEILDGESFRAVIARVSVEFELNQMPTPIQLSTALAKRVIDGLTDIVHIVAITAKICKKRLLRDRPSRNVVGRYMALQRDRRQPHRRVAFNLASQRLPKHPNAMAADEVIDWVGASKHLLNINAYWSCAKSYAALFARRSSETESGLMETLEKINLETLRQARVRTDVVSMLAFRRFWKSLEGTPVNIYLFVDGSPQRRGLELFASTMDVIFPGGHHMRKIFPYIAPVLGMDTLSKTAALLWQVFLLCGPCFHSMRRFCASVRSICSDMGTERNIYRHVDFLRDWFWFVGCKLNRDHMVDNDRLFPRALGQPGWKHLWDLLLRRALCSLSFFPDWLLRFKAAPCVSPSFWLKSFGLVFAHVNATNSRCGHCLVIFQTLL